MQFANLGEAMKVRMHRGGLAESMETAQEIPASKAALMAYLKSHLRFYYEEIPDEWISVIPYHSEPDNRIGWQSTYLVIMKGSAVAFTDSNLAS